MIVSLLSKTAVVTSLAVLVALSPAPREVAAAPPASDVATAHVESAGARVFLGTIFRWYNDPDCPYSPDSHEVLKAYGYDNGNGPVITSVSHSGYTVYSCTGGWRGGVFDAPDPWIFNENAVDPYWGAGSYFPYAWNPGDCWGGGEPCP